MKLRKTLAIIFVLISGYAYSEDRIINVEVMNKKYEHAFDYINKSDRDNLKKYKNIVHSSELSDSKAIKESIDSILTRINSKEYLSDINRFKHEISNKIGVDITENKVEGANGKVLLFISKSIPENTLRSYARDLEKVGGFFVMRGLVEGMRKIRPQAIFASNVLKINPDCSVGCKYRGTEILIDPIMFRKYSIKKVPAVVVQRGLDLYDYCHLKDKFELEKTVIYGDASLKYILEKYKEESNREDMEDLISLL